MTDSYLQIVLKIKFWFWWTKSRVERERERERERNRAESAQRAEQMNIVHAFNPYHWLSQGSRERKVLPARLPRSLPSSLALPPSLPPSRPPYLPPYFSFSSFIHRAPSFTLFLLFAHGRRYSPPFALNCIFASRRSLTNGSSTDFLQESAHWKDNGANHHVIDSPILTSHAAAAAAAAMRL